MTKKKTSINHGQPKKKAAQSTTGRFVQAKKTKKKLTVEELTLLAWQDTYEKRHKRVA